jgi:hypothetical protein
LSKSATTVLQLSCPVILDAGRESERTPLSALVVRQRAAKRCCVRSSHERTNLSVCNHFLLFVLKASATGMLRNLLAHLR